jgi:hypothetical protein
MSSVINIGPISNDVTDPAFNASRYFNNLAGPSINVRQDAGDAVQNYFEKITGNKDSAAILASAVIYTSAAQGMDPMQTLSEFQRMPPGEVNDYIAVFLNLNRLGTSLLGINNRPFVNQFVVRNILV